MLRRVFAHHLRLRFHLQTLTVLSSSHSHYSTSPHPLTAPLPVSSFDPNRRFLFPTPRCFSTSRGDGNGDDDGGVWKISPEAGEVDSVFGQDEGDLAGIAEGGKDAFESESAGGDPWAEEDSPAEQKGDLFDNIDKEFASKEGEEEWGTGDGEKPWSLAEAEEEKNDLFDAGEEGEVGIEGIAGGEVEDVEGSADEKQQLEKKEQELLETLKGPNRAFGDLIAASGITEDMIDSLILLKDVRNIPGLPPLREIEDKAIARMNATSSRAEIERKKQEEIAKARVRQVDEKGRAYGTGRRKCSIARVWIQPGDGEFIVNDKQFDVYFPIIDHRAELLRPFTETKTLGLWNVACTVKGGGVSGQVGAIRLGISRALQNWEPGLRPYLKSAGYLTRDPRVVERKKPGKAKARKSFQWVKR